MHVAIHRGSYLGATMIYPARYFPAKLSPTTDGEFIVTFRDILEAITYGEDAIGAIAMGVDTLYTAKDYYLESGRPMKEPSARMDGEVLVPLYVEDRDEEMQLFGVPA